MYELIFHANGGPADAEREVWLARFPLPHLVTPQSALDEVLLSSVAALRYIEKHVPSNTTGNGLKNLVPVVYGVALKDDPQNKVGASFALMRKMKGRTMRDVYSKRRKDLEWVSERVQALACKFYRQLAGVVMELGTFVISDTSAS